MSSAESWEQERASESNGKSSSNVKATILLPGRDYIIVTWKIKSGAIVRKGETVAISTQRNSESASDGSTGNNAPSNDGSGGNNTTGNASTIGGSTAATQHKRPVRRRKMVPPAAAAAAVGQQAPTLTAKHLERYKNPGQRSQSTSTISSESSAETDKSEQSNNSKNTSLTKSIETVPLLATADGILRISQTPSLEQPLVVAYIEECTHPGFLEGLCVVCGTSMKKDENDLSSSDLYNASSESLSQVTVSGGVTMTVSKEEGRNIAQKNSERLLKQQKLSLVLDLDHTLVHATSDPRARQFHAYEDDVRTLRLPLMEGIPGAPPPGQPHMWMQHFAKLRPHIKQFLEIVQPMYELTVYTAGTRHYAEEITIVLCRHLVGSQRDVDDIEQLRYEFHMAETEYNKHNSLGSTPNQNGNDQHGEGDKKRKSSEMETNGAEDSSDPSQKKKKVSFGPPQDETMDDTSGKTSNNRSDHMTFAKLEELRNELREAEELECRAWELRQKIFGSRVVSRTDVGDLGRDVKSLKRIFPCGGTLAAVIDDREDVWANATDNGDDIIRGEPPNNLLLVRPYHWQPFVGFADINNAAGDDLSGNGPGNVGTGTEAETDVQLIWTSRILRGLHRRFYNQTGDTRKTVPEILSQMRKEVLRGSTLVLSGLVPLHKKSIGVNSARPPIVRYAQSLGANLLDNVQPGVTHVVAAKDGTDKALAARKIPGCYLVRPSWLVECYWSMTRRDVRPHLMGEGPQESATTTTTTTTKIDNYSDGSNDTDSDDDELEAALEEEMMNG